MASILMTVTNKFVVSGSQFTMTFLRESHIARTRRKADARVTVLTLQSAVCVACVGSVKKTGLISCTCLLVPSIRD